MEKIKFILWKLNFIPFIGLYSYLSHFECERCFYKLKKIGENFSEL